MGRNAAQKMTMIIVAYKKFYKVIWLIEISSWSVTTVLDFFISLSKCYLFVLNIDFLLVLQIYHVFIKHYFNERAL